MCLNSASWWPSPVDADAYSEADDDIFAELEDSLEDLEDGLDFPAVFLWHSRLLFMDVSYNARRLSNIPEGNRGSSSSIFTSKDGSPLRVFVESSGITNRPELVRLLRVRLYSYYFNIFIF